MKTIEQLTRPNIRSLKPYSSARDEYKGRVASVFLDANENPYSESYNRYPDPLQHQLKERLAAMKGVDPGQIFLGNGSDEAIDLLFRAFCRPGVENVVAIDPTYGMYQVCADINDVAYRKVLLDEDFQFRADDLLAAADAHTKLIFLCSPNNPTGNDLRREEMDRLLDQFDGLVVVDEAYIDFSGQPSYTGQLSQRPHLVILQTFSKAWGSAAIRLGMAFAAPEIIAVFNKIKYPYNVNQLTQEEALRLLSQPEKIQRWVTALNEQRGQLMERFAALPFTERVFPSDANFFLARVSDAGAIYNYLVEQGIIVRNRHSVSLCGNCLRITIGTSEENHILLETLRKFTNY